MDSNNRKLKCLKVIDYFCFGTKPVFVASNEQVKFDIANKNIKKKGLTIETKNFTSQGKAIPGLESTRIDGLNGPELLIG